jgi:hypothetical protein
MNKQKDKGERNMPHRKKIVGKKKPISKEEKKEVLDAIIVDMLADKLSVEHQEKLPNEGVMVTQSPEEGLAIQTDVVSELPKPGIVVTSETAPEVSDQKQVIADAIGQISIAQPILDNVHPTKGDQASEALNFISDQIQEEAQILISKDRFVIGKALLIAARVLKTSSKTVNFFSKLKKKRKH